MALWLGCLWAQALTRQRCAAAAPPCTPAALRPAVAPAQAPAAKQASARHALGEPAVLGTSTPLQPRAPTPLCHALPPTTQTP